MIKFILILNIMYLIHSQTLNASQIQQVQSLSQSQLQTLMKQTGVDAKVGTQTTNKSGTQDASSINNNDLIVKFDDVSSKQVSNEIKEDTEGFFGEEFFKNFKLKPNTYGPVPDSYILGSGDEILITLYGEVQINEELMIDREGAIIPKDIGRILLANISFSDAKNLITKAFQKYHRSIKSGKTYVHVTVGKQRRVQVSVLGAVNFPTNMNLSALNTVFDAVVMAGGPTEKAALRNLKIIRGNNVIRYDLYNNLVPGLNKVKQVRLENGDVIVLGTDKKAVRISGAVRTPDAYEIGDISTVDEIITIAGGLKYTASIDYASISTIQAEEEIVLNFNSVDDLKKYILKDGDRISIKSRNVVDSSYVEITGAVLYPGRYAFKKNQTIKSLIDRSGGILKTSFEGRYDIRRKLNSKEYKSITVGHEDITKTKLEVGDIVTLYDKMTFITEREIRIFSYAQGFLSFPFDQESDVYDYLSKIGGIKYTEDDSFVEVVRLTGDKNPNNYARLFEVKINKEYLSHDVDRYDEWKLEPDDIIIIRKNPDIETYQTVKIHGEVKSAGTYPLIKRDEKVSDLIRRAKGFKSSAYLEGSRFYRKVSTENVSSQEVNLNFSYVRIPVDFAEVMDDLNSEENIFLVNEDSIFIPKNPYVVKVEGAVLTPTAVIYKEGASVEYYIKQAGGISELGDDARVQVVKANGKQYESGLFSSDEITSGSVISVPKRVVVDENSTKEIIQTVSTYITSFITTFLLLRSVGN